MLIGRRIYAMNILISDFQNVINLMGVPYYHFLLASALLVAPLESWAQTTTQESEEIERLADAALLSFDAEVEPANFPQCVTFHQGGVVFELRTDCRLGVFPQTTVRWSDGDVLRYRLERNEFRRVRARGTGAILETTAWDLSRGDNAVRDVRVQYLGRVPPPEIEASVLELLDAAGPRPPGDMFHKIEVQNRSNSFVAFQLRITEEGGDIDNVSGAIKFRSERFYYAFAASDASKIDIIAAREDPR